MSECSLKGMIAEGYTNYYGRVRHIPKGTVIVIQENEKNLMNPEYHVSFLHPDRAYKVNNVTIIQPDSNALREYTLSDTTEYNNNNNNNTKIFKMNDDDISTESKLIKYSLYLPTNIINDIVENNISIAKKRNEELAKIREQHRLEDKQRLAEGKPIYSHNTAVSDGPNILSGGGGKKKKVQKTNHPSSSSQKEVSTYSQITSLNIIFYTFLHFKRRFLQHIKNVKSIVGISPTMVLLFLLLFLFLKK